MIKIYFLQFYMAIFLLFGDQSFASEDKILSFSNTGKLVKKSTFSEFTTKPGIMEITVWEPHENKDVTYRGFEANAVFNAIYGEKWRDAEEVLFTCSDGYQPSVPVERFKKHKAYFVFERLDQKSFKVQNRFQNEKDVELGPYYLVWDNRKSDELRKMEARGWPYQVVATDLVKFADKFPKLSPPEKSNQKINDGFIAFRNNCMACHTINGEGGGKAPELNYPTNVTEYFSDTWLNKWMLEPRSIRFNSAMPSFDTLPDKKDVTANIILYLKAMSKRKIKPN